MIGLSVSHGIPPKKSDQRFNSEESERVREHGDFRVREHGDFNSEESERAWRIGGVEVWMCELERRPYIVHHTP